MAEQTYVNDYDRTMLNSDQQSQLAAAQKAWQEANAKGDKAGMDAAAAQGKAIRASAGYETNSDGTNARMISGSTDSSSSSTKKSGGTFSGISSAAGSLAGAVTGSSGSKNTSGGTTSNTLSGVSSLADKLSSATGKSGTRASSTSGGGTVRAQGSKSTASTANTKTGVNALASKLTGAVNKKISITTGGSDSGYKYTNSKDAQLPAEARKGIEDAQKRYQEGQRTGNQAMMDQARADAEKIRKDYGNYATASDGTNPFDLESAQKIANEVLAGKTDKDMMRGDDYRKLQGWQEEFKRCQANGDQAGMRNAHHQAQVLRMSYDYMANADGTVFRAIPDNTGMVPINGKQYGLLDVGESLGGTMFNGHIVHVNPDGTSQAKVGEICITGGGAFLKTLDGAVLVNRDVTTDNFMGNYSAAGSLEAIEQYSTYTGSTQPSGRIYQVGADGKAPRGLMQGDLVLTDGGTFIIESITEDGEYNGKPYAGFRTGEVLGSVLSNADELNGRLTPEQLASMIANKSKNISGTVMSRDGSQQVAYEITYGGLTYYVDESGNSVSPGGITLMTKNGRTDQGVICQDDSGDMRWVPIDATTRADIYTLNRDGNYERKQTSGSYICIDGRTYNIDTGRSIGNDSDIDPANDVVYANGSYFSVSGENMNEVVNGKKMDTTTDDPGITRFTDTGWDLYNNAPQIKDYKHMTWEQARARAAEQLNASYDKNLEDHYNELNKKALQTGFFGQLPAEALKAQALAANDVEREKAINELANQIYDNSYNEALISYNADTERNTNQLNTIKTIAGLYEQYKENMRDYEIQKQTLSQADAQKMYELTANSYNQLTSIIADVRRSLDPELEGGKIEMYDNLLQSLVDSFAKFRDNIYGYTTGRQSEYDSGFNKSYDSRGSSNDARNTRVGNDNRA